MSEKLLVLDACSVIAFIKNEADSMQSAISLVNYWWTDKIADTQNHCS